MNKSQVDVEALIALATHKEIALEQLITEIETGVLEAYYQTLEPKRQGPGVIDRESG
jgi:N utilization substance protein A